LSCGSTSVVLKDTDSNCPVRFARYATIAVSH
jgi:hypothetical protein